MNGLLGWRWGGRSMRFKASTMRNCGTWSSQRPQMSWEKRWYNIVHGNPTTLTMNVVVRRLEWWLLVVEYISFLFYFFVMYLSGMYSKFCGIFKFIWTLNIYTTTIILSIPFLYSMPWTMPQRWRTVMKGLYVLYILCSSSNGIFFNACKYCIIPGPYQKRMFI